MAGPVVLTENAGPFFWKASA